LQEKELVMKKVTVGVEGMACSMCEAHVQEAIRKAFPEAKKVKADRKKKQVTFISEAEPEAADVEEAVKASGYDYTGVAVEEAKKGLLGWA